MLVQSLTFGPRDGMRRRSELCPLPLVATGRAPQIPLADTAIRGTIGRGEAMSARKNAIDEQRRRAGVESVRADAQGVRAATETRDGHECSPPDSILAAVETRSLRDALRDATREQHARLERSLGITSPRFERDYERFLSVMWRVHKPVERQLAASDMYRDYVPDTAQRWRAELAATDLRALGLPVPAPLTESDLPSLACIGAQLGAAYVFEGSTLGAAIILREFHETGRAGEATRYLSAYGASVGELWRGFLFALESTPLDAEQRRSAVTTARTIFSILYNLAETG